MRYSTQIKPISYFKTNAAQMLQELENGGEPFIITQNGVAKAVLQDVVSYEKTQETLAMLELVQMGMDDIKAGRVRPAKEVIDELRSSHAKET